MPGLRCDVAWLSGRARVSREPAAGLCWLRLHTFSGCLSRGDSKGVVAEAGDEVESASECFDVAGDGFDGCEFAAFDLGDPAGGDAHGRGELGLGEAVALAFFGEMVAALAGHQHLAAPFGFLLPADAFDVGGLSQGGGVGMHLVAVEPRITAAVLGLDESDVLISIAPRITIPVEFVMQWDDAGHPRDSMLTLSGALGSAEKTLHANPGNHFEVPDFEIDSSIGLFARHLGSQDAAI